MLSSLRASTSKGVLSENHGENKTQNTFQMGYCVFQNGAVCKLWTGKRMQDSCQLSLVLLTVMGDVRLWRVEHGEWETGRSGRGTSGTSIKGRKGQQGRAKEQ